MKPLEIRPHYERTIDGALFGVGRSDSSRLGQPVPNLQAKSQRKVASVLGQGHIRRSWRPRCRRRDVAKFVSLMISCDSLLQIAQSLATPCNTPLIAL